MLSYGGSEDRRGFMKASCSRPHRNCHGGGENVFRVRQEGHSKQSFGNGKMSDYSGKSGQCGRETVWS